MDNLDLLVTLDLRTDNGVVRAATEALLHGHGWDVAQASESPENKTLLLHQALSPSDSLDTAVERLAELRRMNIDADLTRGWFYQPPLVEPYVPPGDAQPLFTRLYTTMLLGSSDAVNGISKLTSEIPLRTDSLDPPGAKAANDWSRSFNPSFGTPESTQAGKPAAEYVGSSPVDHEPPAERATWRGVDDFVLFSYIDAEDQGRLAASILRARHGVQSDQAREQLHSNHEKITAARIEAAKVLQQSIDQWRKLAKLAPLFMVLTLLIAVAILAGGFLLAKWGRLDGYQFSVVILMSAVFVASPATLLLLERPLRGVDTAVGKASARHGDDI
jgi:hypothetical protein